MFQKLGRGYFVDFKAQRPDLVQREHARLEGRRKARCAGGRIKTSVRELDGQEALRWQGGLVGNGSA